MSTEVPAYPSADAWVAAIHASEHDFEPIGTAVVIDANRVLTCAHVVFHSRRDGPGAACGCPFPRPMSARGGESPR